VLHELRVENLVLIESARLQLSSGLNVVTGETGAGKTVLTQALNLLLGGRVQSGTVRAGCSEAYVEGVIELPKQIPTELQDLLPVNHGPEVAVARKVLSSGRSRAYIDGRSVNVSDIRQLTSSVLSFYGQHEHRKLMLQDQQLEILDSFCSAEQGDLRRQCAKLYAQVTLLSKQLQELEERSAERAREVDLLSFELNEIESLDPTVEDEQALERELEKLSQIDAVRAAIEHAKAAVTGSDSEGDSGIDRVVESAEMLSSVSQLDSELSSLSNRFNALVVELSELAAESRAYAEQIEVDPQRKSQIEERLTEYDRIKRKHGGSVIAVLEHLDICRKQLKLQVSSKEQQESLKAELDKCSRELKTVAQAMSDARAKAAKQLKEKIEKLLSELAMGESQFEAVLELAESVSATGQDRVELMISANRGMPLAKLRETASGGELSRIMLALLTGSSSSDLGTKSKTLVFDEIDAGIGGKTAATVGKYLSSLSKARQTLCITHLPQVAASADRHFCISKVTGTELTTTEVCQLDADGVLNELVRMLGADPKDQAAVTHAKELLGV